MVKIVIGDETQLKLTEDRLTRSGVPAEAGLVIGKFSSKLDKGFVYNLLPTPPNDSGEPPCSVIDGAGESNKNKKKNSSKAKSQPEAAALFIDKDWVSEHARQVSRMLLGGMKVIGIYVWINENLFKNSTTTLCQTLLGVAEAASSMVSDSNEAVLVHIGYSPLRWTCRNCSLASNITSSSLRPCEFKMGKVLGSLQTFRCTYNFDLRLPIPHDELEITKFSNILRDEIILHAKELSSAKAIINGKLVAENQDELSLSDNFHEVELLLPFLQDKYLEACGQKEVVGVLLFQGSVCSLSYLNSKEPILQALIDIKEDIIRSLLSRLDNICDEADKDLESDGGQENGSDVPVPHFDLLTQRKQCILSLPRRVFVPWLDGTYICDYIQSSETMEVLKDHCTELMSMEVPSDDSEIMEPESNPPTATASTTNSFWDIAMGLSSATKPGDSVSKKTKNIAGTNPANFTDLKSVLSILVLIISLILGLVLYIIGD
ncbi:uncharacterized protein LOC127246481 [Andrographis paniculata]|uniref:uncharacterized protein LOC127246481 n=1 Tax=Andrographis paniculata TaxID=175694 RepID=UPI0021E923A6|nr:uncharacterized protein LOC127246481 [Andrographis paniculata]